MRLTLLLFGLSCAAGCLFVEDIPSDASVTCTDNDDCPRAFRCARAVSRCVPNTGGDDEPPAIVEGSLSLTPTLANATTNVTVRFRVSEELAAEPTATAGPVVFTLEEVASRTWEGSAQPRVGDDGVHALTIELLDTSGNDATLVDLATLTVDARAPRLVESSFVEGPLTAAAPIEGVFVFDEPLAAVDAWLSNGAGDTIVLMPSLEGTRVSLSGEVPPDAPEGEWALEVTVTDAAGNSASELAPAALVIDRTPPSILGANALPPLLGPGEAFVLTLETDEPLAAAPTVSIHDQVFASTSSGVGATFTYTGVLAAPSGGYTVHVEGAADLAGNVAPRTDLDMLIAVDVSPPLVMLDLTAAGEPVARTLNASDVLDIAITVNEAATCAVTVAGVPAPDETFSLAGSGLVNAAAPVRAACTDAKGNVGVGEQRIAIDAVAPDLSTALIYNASNVYRGETLTITVVATEPVLEPTLALSSAAVAGASFVATPDLSERSWTFALDVDRATPEGFYAVETLTLTDLAGNTASFPFGAQRGADVLPAECAPAMHDGGDGEACVPLGQCLPGYFTNPNEDCVLPFYATTFNDTAAGASRPEWANVAVNDLALLGSRGLGPASVGALPILTLGPMQTAVGFDSPLPPHAVLRVRLTLWLDGAFYGALGDDGVQLVTVGVVGPTTSFAASFSHASSATQSYPFPASFGSAFAAGFGAEVYEPREELEGTSVYRDVVVDMPHQGESLVLIVGGLAGNEANDLWGIDDIAITLLPGYCGDGACSNEEACGETPDIGCAADCGSCCGNAVCEPWEGCANGPAGCLQDCGADPLCSCNDDGVCNNFEKCAICAYGDPCGDPCTCQGPIACPVD